MIHVVKNKKEISNILGIENMIIILNFHSETCGPCIMQMPILEDLSNDLKITLLTFDTGDDNDGTLEEFNVTATPTTQIYKNGKLMFTNVGFLPYDKWNEKISKYR